MSLGQHHWQLFLFCCCWLHSPWILERRRLVSLHTWPVLLCVEMVWVRSGASLGKFIVRTGLRILLVSVYVYVYDFFRPASVRTPPPSLRPQTSTVCP